MEARIRDTINIKGRKNTSFKSVFSIAIAVVVVV
jgi:hypothetical protein